MKCPIGLLALLVCVPPQASQATGLQFETSAIQLGDLRAGVPKTCQFSFVNAGTRPIEITQARPGCGCLLPRLDKTHLIPGERGMLAVDLRTLGQPSGPHTWTLAIHYSDGDQTREQVLQVVANVIIEVSVQPASVTMHTQGKASQIITVTDLRDKPLSIQRVETTSPHLRVAVGPFVANASHFASTINLQCSPDLPPGRHEEQVVIHTSDPLYRELRVSATIVKEASQRVVATPKVVNLDISGLVRLRDSEGQKVTIESVSANHPAISWTWAQGPGNDATLRLTLHDSKLQAGENAATIDVQLAGPIREVVTLRVVWGTK